MTINTLRAIQDEHTPTLVHRRPPATATPPAATTKTTAAAAPTTEAVSLDVLLEWGDNHPDPEIQAQATRARLAVAGLRHRHHADRELARINAEAEQLRARLAALDERRAELEPPKKRRTRTDRDYDPATVRAWAAQAGVDCPTRGRVPEKVVDAWRQANA